MRYVLSLTLLAFVAAATWVLVRFGEELLGKAFEAYDIGFDTGLAIVVMAVLLVLIVLILLPLLGRDLVRAIDRMNNND